MKLMILFPLTMLLLLGCETKLPDKKTPEGAFIRLAKCVDSASTKCLFWELDTETRWSVSSIHKLLRQTRSQIEKSYPKDEALRNSVYGKWTGEANAQSAEQMFDIMCKESNCLKKLAKGFGAIEKIEKKEATATIKTIRGETFQMKKVKGNWGIVLFAEKIDGEKIRLSDSLNQVKRNAAEYEQQRLATGQK